MTVTIAVIRNQDKLPRTAQFNSIDQAIGKAMNDAIETFTTQIGNTIVKAEIFFDTHPINPREEYGHLGIMVCNHPDYDLGDEKGDYESVIETIMSFYPELESKYYRAKELYDELDRSYLTAYFDNLFEKVQRVMQECPDLKSEWDEIIENMPYKRWLNKFNQLEFGNQKWMLDNQTPEDMYLSPFRGMKRGKYEAMTNRDEDFQRMRELESKAYTRIFGRAHRVHKMIEQIVEAAFNQTPTLNLYLYDHSGISISSSPFSCPWDSGQVGVMYMEPKAFKENFDGDMEKAIKRLESEVEEYDAYLTGQCYGYIVSTVEVDEDGEGDGEGDGDEIDKSEVHESCWGFLGNIEYCIEEAKALMKAVAEEVKGVKEVKEVKETAAA